jgi:Uma2 family endonuclease
MATDAKIRMTAEEFSHLPETNQPTELIHGELIVSPAPTPLHQRISRRLQRLLEDLIPNGEVFDAPIDLYLDEANIPQPDLVWVSADGTCRVTEKRLEGPPELVVEIFSPGTARYDKDEKFKTYQRFGVREYWMADPVNLYVEVFALRDGAYESQGVYGPQGSFTSPALGKTVDLSDVFA